MKTTKAIRFLHAAQRIREHHPDVEVLEASTGRRRYYHEWCGGVAYAAARERGGAWLATYRHVEVSAN